jgi:hypothetical protein
MPPLKNLRQETFCQEYLKDKNGSRSYKAAGYKCGTPGSIAVGTNQILKNIKVRDRIMELEAPLKRAKQKADLQVAEKAIIDRAWVVGKLVTNVDRSMQAEPVLDKTGRPTGVYTYEGGVANRGLELIGKNLGMFQDKSPLEGLLTGASVTVSVYLPEKHQKPLIVGNGHDHGHTNGD